jgi:hypothetical protein
MTSALSHRSGPRALAHAFHDVGVRSTALSKYCLGVAMLADNLRANPWRRTMRRHFAADPPSPATVANRA